MSCFCSGMRGKMEFNKSVSNPMLVGAIKLMREEDTPEHRTMLTGEIMKAHFLAPAIIMPEPEKTENGELKIQIGSKVQFPMLSTPDGKQFFMAFTDSVELKKWKDDERIYTFALTFDDYAGMLLTRKEGKVCPALGFVINPFGGNVLVTREMVASFVAARIAQAKGKKPPMKP